MNRFKILMAGAAFASTVLLANWMTETYGFITLFGFSMTAGTLAAGLGFGLRDVLHTLADRRRRGDGWRAAAIAIIIGAVLSYAVAPALAVASAVAFFTSEIADLLVFQRLRRRNWPTAVAASNLVAAVADTVIFLGLAFGVSALTRDAVLGQLVGKGLMILPALVVMRWARGNR